MKDKSIYPYTAQTMFGPSVVSTGLTRRELFAALAMEGMLADILPLNDRSTTGVATAAVAFADALIAELDKEPK